MSSNLKPVPHFSSEEEEREFWAEHNSTEYIDWSKAVKNLASPHFKPSSHTKQRNKQAHGSHRKSH